MIRCSSATSLAGQRASQARRRASWRPAGLVRSASSASATSTVRLPSVRSSPAGLPVTSGSPNTPSRSSRSWKASPSGSAVRRERLDELAGPRRPARRRRAAAARRSTSPTCSAAPASTARRRRRRGPAPRRRGTARRSPRCGWCRRSAARRAPARGAARRCAAARRPRTAAGRRAGSAAAAPYCSGSPRQPSRAVARREGAVDGRAGRAGCRRRP